MLDIQDLHVCYGKKEVLHGVSLLCKQGSITVILGPNGCGKSTLLKTITGILPIASGEVSLHGISMNGLKEMERSRKISYLSQGKGIPDITAGRMVLHGRFPYLSYPRRYRKEDFAVAAKVMHQMWIESYQDQMMNELSGGMRQKVYIAMAMAQESDVILMDEPTTYLDIGQQFRLADTIKELAHQGKTLLLVLHDILLAFKLADTIVIMQDGCIKKIASPEEIQESSILQEIYGIRINRIRINGNDEYYYETEPKERL